MRNDPVARDAPKPITPPSGDVEVYVYDPTKKVAERTLWCGDDIGRADDVTERLARMGVESGKRMLRIVPDGDNPLRLSVTDLIACNSLDMEPVR